MKKFILYILVFLIFITNLYFSLFYKLNCKEILDKNNSNYQIFFQIRIPRTVATYIVGAGISVVGCVLQSIFLNPLCEGYTLGISSSAAVGVILINLLNLPLSRFLGSFLGVIISVLSIYILILVFKQTIDISFVLAGVVLNFLFSSIIIILTIFFDPYKLHYILLWLLGSFTGLDKTDVYLSGIIILSCVILILNFSRQLDVLVLGKEKAVSLGVEEHKLKNILMFTVVLISALCVSLAGVISFVGIFIPNFVKNFTGLKHKNWVLSSAMLGGILVSLCDNLAKNLFYPIEVPISVFTGFAGGLFFIIYLVKRKNIIWKY